MTEVQPDHTAVAVRFGSSERTYHYWCTFPIEKGQRVIVPTKRGEATVTVVEVLETSASATAEAIRPAPTEPEGVSNGQ